MNQPPRRALIVIDVQNEYVTGNLPIEYPPVQQSLANIGRAMDAAYAAGLPVVVAQQSSPSSSPLFAKGTPGWTLHDAVSKRHRDHHIEKTFPSAFTGTDLAEWLATKGINTLVVAGFMTHNCDVSTMIHALHDGLMVEFLSDAAGSAPYANSAGQASAEELHRVFSVVLQSRFAAVLSTDAWIAALASGVPPERDTIAMSNQRARLSRLDAVVVA